MATMAQAMPDQSAGAAPQDGGAGAPPQPQGGGQQPPSQAQASKPQQILGMWTQVAKEFAAAYPSTASAMNKAVQAFGEAQTALVAPPQPTPMSQQPGY